MYYRKLIKLGGTLYVGVPSQIRDKLGLYRGGTVKVGLFTDGIHVLKDEEPKEVKHV